MPIYNVMITRTKTIEATCEIEVRAKDEDAAIEKVTEKFEKAQAKADLSDYDFEDQNEEDSFEYEASEA